MPSIEDTHTIKEAAAFLRRERLRRGWTAQDLANKLMQIASAVGEELSLTQQAISYFETGKTKSLPRWLRHVDLAFLDHGLAQQSGYFAGKPIDEISEADLSPENMIVLTKEEHDWLFALRSADPEIRASLLQLARTIAAKTTAPRVHDNQHTSTEEDAG